MLDGRREWGIFKFDKFVAELGKEVIVSAPDNQRQNELAERGIKFLQDAARCCAIQTKVPTAYWDNLLETACYRINMTSQLPLDREKNTSRGLLDRYYR